MDESDSHNSTQKRPKITILGEKDSLNRNILTFDNNNLDIYPEEGLFAPNQKSNLTIHSDGILEFCILQNFSTPGIKYAKSILMPPGKYVFTVLGFSEVEKTFFPWVREVESRTRLTETIHLSKIEDPTVVHFTLDEESKIEIGILSHRQEIGDKCYIRSVHISADCEKNSEEVDGNEKIIKSDYIPHHDSKIEVKNDGILVSSHPHSTPGAYKFMDVKNINILSISVSVSVTYPSVAFLYVADANSGKELTSRNNIFESSKSSAPSSLLTSVVIPQKTKKIRIGILFSTSVKPIRHEMIIHKLEAIEYKSIKKISDKFYVLNLEKDLDKFTICKRQADRLGLELTRWKAIDGNSDENYSSWSNYMSKPWTEQDLQLNRKSIDKPGAWGYLLTMKGIIEDAISNNYDKITVFDDDFVLSNSFEHNFSKLINSLPDKWHVLYLGASQWSWDGVNIDNMPFYIANSDTNGSFAVIYDQKIFKTLLLEIEKMISPFDAGPLRRVVNEISPGKCFVAYPNLVIANLEKDGIRDSRNQKDYSRRFRWDLQDFPPYFTSWTGKPVLIRDDVIIKRNPEKPNFVTAVTTFNRLSYLQDFIKRWDKTRNNLYHSTLIIADDGSSDGTIEWLSNFSPIDDASIIVIQNDGSGIARQTNSIINYVSSLSSKIDMIFMCNDDIKFLKENWDMVYYNAAMESNFSHLVYFNPNWKKPSFDYISKNYPMLHSSCNARNAMGCFYTLTPDIIDKIGFFDEDSFPVRGHSHIDYTIRACNIRENEYDNLYDIKNSNEYIGMVLKDGYVRTHRTLTLNEKILTTSDIELKKREELLQNRTRKFISKGW